MARHALPVMHQQPHGQQLPYGPYQHPGPFHTPAEVHMWPQAAQAVHSQGFVQAQAPAGFADRQHQSAQMLRRLFVPYHQSSQGHGSMPTAWHEHLPYAHIRQQQVATCRPLQPQPPQIRPAQLADVLYGLPVHPHSNAGAASSRQQLSMADPVSQAHAMQASKPAVGVTA